MKAFCVSGCSQEEELEPSGEAKRSDCAEGPDIEVYFGGQRVGLVPFVQKALRGSILGFVREMKGYQDNA